MGAYHQANYIRPEIFEVIVCVGDCATSHDKEAVWHGFHAEVREAARRFYESKYPGQAVDVFVLRSEGAQGRPIVRVLPDGMLRLVTQ